MKRNRIVQAALIIVAFMCSTSAFSNENKYEQASIAIPSSNETFLLVHSAWLGAWQWDGVKKELEAQGHNVITPDLPGHGNDKTSPADITMEDYVKTVTDILDKQAKPIILVGHSFNGITVSRAAELRPDKVKSIVYLTAFLLPNGGSFFNAVQGVKGSKAVENFYLSDDKTYALVNEDQIQNAFAHDIPVEAFNEAKPYIVPEPAAPLSYELQVTEKNFGRIPKFYIECTEDRAIPLAVQRAMYNGKVMKAYSINSSHTPNFSQPGKVASILGEIAQEQKDLEVVQQISYNLTDGRTSSYRNMFADRDQDKALKAFLQGGKTVQIHRLMSGDNQVLAHIEALRGDKFYAEMILFQLNEKGKIAKFYSTRQEVPAQQLDGLSMFDGVKTATSDENEMKNKKHISRFLNDVWIGGNVGIIQEFFHDGKVIQHNPQVHNNVEGLFEFLQYIQKNNISLQYKKVVSTFSDENFVLTYSTGKFAGEEYLFSDLFRLENGKIVEHWDVIQKK